MATTTKIDIEALERFLRVRGWKPSDHMYHAFISADSDWAVELDVDAGECLGISISKFTDGDLPNDAYKGGFEAVGRYETVGDECRTLEELDRELVSLGAMEFECPNCGHVGGKPRHASESEHYGADADGTRGVMRESTVDGCDHCVKTYWRA